MWAMVVVFFCDIYLHKKKRYKKKGMDPLPVHVTLFVESTTGNKFDPDRSHCYNPMDIVASVDGTSTSTVETRCVIEDGCMIRADLSRISMGKYCILEQNVILRPPRNM